MITSAMEIERKRRKMGRATGGGGLCGQRKHGQEKYFKRSV